MANDETSYLEDVIGFNETERLMLSSIFGLAARRDPIFQQHEANSTRRTEASTSHCKLWVIADNGRVTLEGIVDRLDQVKICADVASRLKGVKSIENPLKAAEVPARLRGG